MTNPTDLKSALKSRISAAIGVGALALVLGLSACNQPTTTEPEATAPEATDSGAMAPEEGATEGTSMDSGAMAPEGEAAPADGMTPAPDAGAPPAETP